MENVRKASNLYKHALKYLVKVLYPIIFRAKFINTEYIPEKGRVIIMSNHVNNLDPCNILCSTKRHVYFLAKSELFKPWYGFAFKAAGCISVDCDHKSHESTVQAINLLNEDEAVGIFPEGRVKREDDIVLQPFKMGVVKLAKETGSLIVPCAIIGKYKMFKKGLKVVYGKAVDIKDMSYEEANKYLYDIIYKLLIENTNEN